MRDKADNKTMQLQTKVSPEVYARLEGICKSYGFSIFQLLRMLCDCIVRFMDDRHNLSEDLVRVIRMFEGIEGWKKSACLADSGQDFEPVEAFYVLRSKGRDGYRLVHVERPVMDGSEEWNATYNVQRILERFIEVTSPSLYRHLRQMAVDLGTESMLDTLHTLASLYRENPDESELRRQFESNDWHRGAQTGRDTVYQRRNTRSISYLEREHPELFDDNLFTTKSE